MVRPSVRIRLDKVAVDEFLRVAASTDPVGKATVPVPRTERLV